MFGVRWVHGCTRSAVTCWSFSCAVHVDFYILGPGAKFNQICKNKHDWKCVFSQCVYTDFTDHYVDAVVTCYFINYLGIW